MTGYASALSLPAIWMKRRPYEDPRQFETDYLQQLLNNMVRDTVSMPATVQQQSAALIAQAYASGARAGVSGIQDIPIQDSGLLFNGQIIQPFAGGPQAVQVPSPRTIGELETLLARAAYPDIITVVNRRYQQYPDSDPAELIQQAIVGTHDAIRAFDPTKARGDASYINYISSSIYSTVTGQARAAGAAGPNDVNAGTDNFWYNQMAGAIGENAMPGFYTMGGTPIVSPGGIINPTLQVLGAGTRQFASLLPGRQPVPLTAEVLRQYGQLREQGFYAPGVYPGSQTSLRAFETTMRRVGSNMGSLGQLGGAPAIGSAAQEFDALAFMEQREGDYGNADLSQAEAIAWGYPEVQTYMGRLEGNFASNTMWFGAAGKAARGNFKNNIPWDVMQNVRMRLNDMVVSGESNGVMPRLVYNPDGSFTAENDMGSGFGLMAVGRSASEDLTDRQVIATSSLQQEVGLNDTSMALSQASQQIDEMGVELPQVTYQAQLMNERMTYGQKVRPGFNERYAADNPGLQRLSKSQYAAGGRAATNFLNKPYSPVMPNDPLQDAGVTGYVASPEELDSSAFGSAQWAAYYTQDEMRRTPLPAATEAARAQLAQREAAEQQRAAMLQAAQTRASAEGYSREFGGVTYNNASDYLQAVKDWSRGKVSDARNLPEDPTGEAEFLNSVEGGTPRAKNQTLPAGVKFKTPEGVGLQLGEIDDGQISYYDREARVIHYDVEAAKLAFKNRSWTRPNMQGVKGFGEKAFSTLNEWLSFGLEHEAVHSTDSNQELEGADKENDANRKAYAKVKGSRDYLPFNSGDAATEDLIARLRRAGVRDGFIQHLSPEQAWDYLDDPSRQHTQAEDDWDRAHSTSTPPGGTPPPNTGSRTPPSQRVTDEQVDDLLGRARGIGFQSAIGINSRHVGRFEGRFERTPNGSSRLVGGQFQLNGQVSLSEEQTGEALDVARNAVTQAMGQGGLEGMDPTSAVATIYARTHQAIKAYMENVVRAAGQMDPAHKASAELIASKQQEVASAAAYKEMGNKIGDQFYPTGDFTRNPVPIGRDANHLRDAMEANPALAAEVERLGGAEALVNGPGRILIAGNQAYGMGQGQWGNTQRVGSWSGGGSNPPNQPPDNPDDEWKRKSPRQTDFGRAMMAAWMGETAWNMTAGKVFTAADQYGQEMHDLIPLLAYGGEDIRGAASLTSQRSLVSEQAGSLAYQMYGPLLNPGAMIGPGGIQIAQAAGVGLGVGAVAGMGAWGLGLAGLGAVGAAAGPIGIIAGAAAGVPLLLGAGYNAFTGQTPDEGFSLRNAARGYAIHGAMLDEGLGNWETFVGPRLTGKGNDQLLERYFAGRSELAVIQEGMPYLSEDQARSLLGPSHRQKEITSLAEEVAKETGLTFQEAGKELVPLQGMLGGLSTDEERDLATQLIQRSQDTGQDIASTANQLASMRGLAPGTQGFLDVVKSYLAAPDSSARTAMQLQASHEAQGFNQLAPYIQGSVTPAADLYSRLRMTLPQAQAGGSMLAGAATAYQRELTPVEAENFLRSSQSLGKYSTRASSWASSLDQMGAMDYGSAISMFDNLISGGADPNYIGELMSFNKYGWSDFGRSAGIGVYQTVDSMGMPAGVRDMSGLIQFMQQNGVGGTTGAQTLSNLGITDAGYQNALMSGGLWSLQDLHQSTMYGLQMQALGIQGAQIGENLRFVNQMWPLQQKQDAIQWEHQEFQFAQSQKQLDLSNKFWLENWQASKQQSQVTNQFQNWSASFDYQTQLMQRDWQRENFNYQQQMSSLQYGWNLEDINEQIRRSSGYERAQLIKQRGRMNTTYNLESDQAEDEQKHQEELWKREDERFQKQQEYSKQLQKLDEERFEREKRQHDAMAKIDQENLNEQKKTAKELHELQQQMAKAQHEHELQQLALAQAALGVQIKQAEEQERYRRAQEAIQRQQQEQAAQWQKISQYAPAGVQALSALLYFLQQAPGLVDQLYASMGSGSGSSNTRR